MSNVTNLSIKNRMAWRLGYLVAALGIYLMDQASKAWAVRRLRFEDRTIIRGVLDLVYAENRGIAFGQLQEGGAFGRWFFVVLAAAAAIAVLFYFCISFGALLLAYDLIFAGGKVKEPTDHRQMTTDN